MGREAESFEHLIVAATSQQCTYWLATRFRSNSQSDVLKLLNLLLKTQGLFSILSLLFDQAGMTQQLSLDFRFQQTEEKLALSPQKTLL